MKRRSRTAWQRLPAVGVFAILAILAYDIDGWAQEVHPHTPGVSGMPRGVPFFCRDPTVTSTRSGSWSDPQTWSTRAVPGSAAKVAIAAGHEVVYDIRNEVPLECVEVRGRLAFSTTADTLMSVGTLMVLEAGHLEIGSPADPVAEDVTAEIVIADRPPSVEMDPGQVGTGIIGLGRVTMHGAVKTPTFVRLSREPLAGHATIELEQPAAGWRAGDHVVIPDTRQLRASERGVGYISQTEKIQIASVTGTAVTLVAPLEYDHAGGRNAEGRLEFLPHVGNLSRNVIVRSENPDGTRGHTMFISRADVDLRYAEFRELGRTKNGSVDNTRFDTGGRTLRIGTNQLGRYAIHFHHCFGPTTTPSNGHQFTLIGNAVDGAPKWGITIHRSHHGLIRDNVVHNTRGAGIATEDGSESVNMFDHNFSVRSEGRTGSLLGGGYGGSLADMGVEGAGFWFRGPNNHVRNNVAADATTYGFALPLALGSVRTPVFQGGDTSKADESERTDMTNAALLEFADNEAYGTIQIGLESVWNGTVSSLTVWHQSRHGFAGIPPEQLTVDKLTVRGDLAALGDPLEEPVGVSIANYISRDVVVTDADVQGMRVGILSPFFYSQTPEPGRDAGSFVIENGYFRNHVGVSVATAYTANGGRGVAVKRAEVRRSVFEPLDVPAADAWPIESISMNYEMHPGDLQPRDPILVYDYNNQPGDDFKVYYSHQAPEAVAPCHDAQRGIGGWVCR